MSNGFTSEDREQRRLATEEIFERMKRGKDVSRQEREEAVLTKCLAEHPLDAVCRAVGPERGVVVDEHGKVLNVVPVRPIVKGAC